MGVPCPRCFAENADTQRFCGECGAPLNLAGNIPASVTETLETPQEQLTTGSTFAGRYQIIEELGHGGMGRVYRALDKKISEEVAVKLIRAEIASERRTLERFANELKAARRISHKNVGRMFHLSEDKGTHYITMEYVPGEDLRRMIRMSKQLSIGTAVDIARQIAEGLAEAHRQGIVHRDLKPSNIMIDRDGNARIMDFGIARLLASKGITGAGIAVGTPEYMSPEQVDGKEADPRADIYSLGIILYEMVTGRVPFEADTPYAIGFKHKNERPAGPKTLNPQVPEDLNGLILGCLEKDPGRRPQTADELRLGLEKIEKGLPTTAPALPAAKRTPLSSREITIKFTARKLIVPGLAFMALIAVVVFGVVFLSHRASHNKASLIHKQITFTGGSSNPAISPDGKFLGYADVISGNEYKVMVQDIASGQVIEVSRGRNIGGLRWSPDGSELVFYRQNPDGTWTSSIVPRLGGKERWLSGSYYATWSPDGSQIASWSDEKKQLSLTNKTTGESKSLSFDKTLPAYAEDLDWSPSGKFIALSMYDDDDKYSIWTITVDGKHQTKIIEDSVNSLGSPRWSPRGDAIYYLLYREQTTDIWKMPVSPDTARTSGPPKPILEGHQVGDYFTLTGNGEKLAYTREVYYSNLWLASLDGLGKDQKVSVRQLTTGTLRTMAPSFSPDGRSIVFGRGSGGTMNIFLMPAEGGLPQQLTFMNSWNYGPVWSPDGTEIAFGSNQGNSSRIWKVSAAGGTPKEINKIAAYWPAWAPGRKILFGTTGTSVLMAVDPVSGETVSILKEESPSAMHYPAWSPDGLKVAVRRGGVGGTGLGLWICSLDNHSELLLRKGNAIPICWSPDGKRIYASEQVSGGINTLVISTEGGRSELLFKLTLNPEMGTLMLRPHSIDGKHFVFEGSKSQSDVWLVENFDSDIK